MGSYTDRKKNKNKNNSINGKTGGIRMMKQVQVCLDVVVAPK